MPKHNIKNTLKKLVAHILKTGEFIFKNLNVCLDLKKLKDLSVGALHHCGVAAE